MKHLLDPRAGLAVFLVLTLSACATFTQPETLEERLAAVTIELTIANNQITTLAQAGVIGENTAPILLDFVTQSERAIEAAHAAVALGDLRQAETQIELGRQLLVGLTARLAVIQGA